MYMNMHVPFSVAMETVVAGEMTQSSSHESQSAETHNERRHVTHMPKSSNQSQRSSFFGLYRNIILCILFSTYFVHAL